MTDTDLSARLDRIARLTDQLAAVQRESLAAQLLLADIHRELAVTRNVLQILETHPPFRTR